MGTMTKGLDGPGCTMTCNMLLNKFKDAVYISMRTRSVFQLIYLVK